MRDAEFDPVSADLTVVVNFHNMRREAPRTLASLAPGYQRGTSNIAYEIVALDNGSTQPLDPKMVRRVGGDRCRHVVVDTESASPAAAINWAIRQSSSEWIMCIIDGARMASPGIVRMAVSGSRLFARPFVYTLAMHLGDRLQNDAVAEGYDQSAEDALLATIDWRRNGYALFNVSTVSPLGVQGFFSELGETNCFLMRREDYLSIGGLSEEFQSPGGGLVNHDFFNRVHENAEFSPVMLLGEATFHQFHGGVSTNVPFDRHPWSTFTEEYRQIRGRDFRRNWRPPIYLGRLPEECRELVNQPPGIPGVSKSRVWRKRLRRLFVPAAGLIGLGGR